MRLKIPFHEEKRKLKKRSKKYKIIRKSIFLIIIGLLVFFIYGFFMITSGTEANKQALKLNSQIYDSKGTVIGKLIGEENREWIPIKRIPKNLQNAFIAIEDRRFYDHYGVDIFGLIRAMLNSIRGGHTEGASTITMQLVKNLNKDTEKSIYRKLREQYRAIDIEKKLTKEEILEMYLNTINLGGNLYGVKTATKRYFGKELGTDELTLGEAACIASITQNPSQYAPLTPKGIENNILKQKTVLKYMQDCGFINNLEYENAIQEPVKIEASSDQKNNAKLSFGAELVVEELTDNYAANGTSKNDSNAKDSAKKYIYESGLNIHSTIDSDIQRSLDTELENFYNIISSYDENLKLDKIQAAAVILNSKNGNVLAITGGLGKKKSDFMFNYATQLKRPPGIVFSPLSVYAKYLDNNKAEVRGGIDMADQQQTIKTWQYLTSSKGNAADYMKFMKNSFPTEKVYFENKYALGEIIKTCPFEIAARYVPFANNGTYFPPSSYTEVEDDHLNHHILSKTDLNKYSSNKIYPKETVEAISLSMQMTSSDIIHVPVDKPQNKSMPFLASISEDKQNFWIVGISERYTICVWYGSIDNKPLLNLEKGLSLFDQSWNNIANKLLATS